MKFRFVLILIVLLIVTGCVTTTTPSLMDEQREFEIKLLKTMKTWEGSHISQLVQRVGPPTEKTSDEASGTIYIWKIDPSSLPPLYPYEHIEHPRIQSPPRTTDQALVQSTSRLIYLQRITKRDQHYYEMAKLHQRMLSMKRMFYVRPDGTIYLAHLTFQ